MVEKLKEILLEEFKARPDGRALVFVCTRELTIALKECMCEDPDLQFLRTERLVGVQASKEKGGKQLYFYILYNFVDFWNPMFDFENAVLHFCYRAIGERTTGAAGEVSLGISSRHDRHFGRGRRLGRRKM